jgi:hypothetical protein
LFVIALASAGYQTVFGHGSVATYLNRTLRPHGTLLSSYSTLGSADLPDYLAMVSGQSPNADTRADCPTFAEFPSSAAPAANGLIAGTGCVYPNTVLTIGDQITSRGNQWAAYVEGMGTTAATTTATSTTTTATSTTTTATSTTTTPTTTTSTVPSTGTISPNCQHPDSGALDPTPTAPAGTHYATRHNPFVYFHSLLDLGDCMNDDKPLDPLTSDLRAVKTTPQFSFIVPDRCNDGSTPACPGEGGGLLGADAFLHVWVPKILASPAYKKDAALIIAFTTQGPTAGAPEAHDKPVRLGALVVSRFAKPRAVLSGAYNPYSLLRSVEDLLGLKALGRAASARSFAADAFPGA